MTISRREGSCTLPSECRSCKDQIVWVVWPKSGKRMPVDYKPVPTGDVVVTHQKEENRLIADKFRPIAHEGRNRYVCHFETCTKTKPPRERR